MNRGIALALCLALSGCGGLGLPSMGSPSPQPTTSGCEMFQPVKISDAAIEAMSEQDQDEIIVHNRTWACACDPQWRKTKECRRLWLGLQ